MFQNRDFENEFEFITSRSSGAGGQHVNKTNSKVELRFNINTSELLTPQEKSLIIINLSNKINNDGFIQIVSQTSRSQYKNKKECVNKFYKLLEEALKIEKERKITKRSYKSILKRLEFKKPNKEKKNMRKNDLL